MDRTSSHKCIGCGLLFANSKFPNVATYGYRCNECLKIKRHSYYLVNRLRIKAYSALETTKARKRASNAKYRASNRDKVNLVSEKWHQRNRTRSSKNKLDWRTKNVTKQRAAELRYRERNRVICNARIKDWKKNNPHKISRRPICGVKPVTPKWANLEVIKAIYLGARKLGKDWHVDHAIPLKAKTVCGLHCEFNLQIIPKLDNLRKHNSVWPEMP